MTDIVERLRDMADQRHMDRGNDAVDDALREAAVEIERHRALIETLVKALTAAQFSSEELCQDQFEGNECWVTLNTIRAALAAAKEQSA